jgi:type I restriction enzyme M protein
MSNGDLNWITNFIWGIADDALRDQTFAANTAT